MPESTVADLPVTAPPAGDDDFDLLALKGQFRAAPCRGKPGRYPTVLLPDDPAVIERLRRGEATRGNCSHLTKTHSSNGASVYTCEHAPERSRAAQRAAAREAATEAPTPTATKDKRRGTAKLRETGVKGAQRRASYPSSG